MTRTFQRTRYSNQELAQMLLFLLENCANWVAPIWRHEVEDAAENENLDVDYTIELARLLDSGSYDKLLKRCVHSEVDREEPEHRLYRRVLAGRLIQFGLEHKLAAKLHADARQRVIDKLSPEDRKLLDVQ